MFRSEAGKRDQSNPNYGQMNPDYNDKAWCLDIIIRVFALLAGGFRSAQVISRDIGNDYCYYGNK